jgi:hypothetical protein
MPPAFVTTAIVNKAIPQLSGHAALIIDHKLRVRRLRRHFDKTLGQWVRTANDIANLPEIEV